MADENKLKQDFASEGSESFQLNNMQAGEEKVVLNIQDDQAEAVVLNEGKVNKNVSTGSFLVDNYNRLNKFFLKLGKIKPQDKSTFYHLLAVMINAGIPMIKALKSLAIQNDKNPKLKDIIEDLADSVESGTSLSQAMANYPDLFTEQELGMIQSGEASGQLNRVLENLAQDTEKAYTIKSKVKSAMTYPIVILSLLVLVIGAMMVFVIPQLKDLFESSDKELPLITKAVVALSNFLVESKLMIAIVFLMVVLGFILFRKTKVGRFTIDKFKIKMPIFGKLFKKAYLARFARSLGNLLDSNVSFVKTLEITADSIGNVVYKKRLMLSVEDIKQGIPLAENMSDTDLFPPMLVNMIEVGEQTAQLDEISQKVATFYEDEVDTAVAGISKIIEPVILIVIGLSVGAVVAAIMLPIMQLVDISGAI